ncbi:dnaJ homolog subfamily C member 3-like isoform X2 [Lepidochelys kempii]|uniref:dnaJ homolog subfamily C member 3-like isoform X2 n=1 Tax=Lepidochelys kempii TaxID=8472 RepID=UPI003C6FE405
MEPGRGAGPGPGPGLWRCGRRLLWAASLLCVLLDLQLPGLLASGQAEIENHLEMGRKLLAAGQLAEALSHYHSAVEGDPKNYLTYYKRATIYLAMGKFRSALPDLSKAIELKPDFLAARLQRGSILLKQGNTEQAKQDFEAVLQSDPSHKEAQSQLARLTELEVSMQEARAAYQRTDYAGAIRILERAVEISPWAPEAKELRAECYLLLGDYGKAILDLKPTTKLRADNRAAFLKLSQLYYGLGEHEEALAQVRECLKLDQDDKACFAHYKQVKKLSKQLESAEEHIQAQRYEEAIDKYKAAMKTESQVELYIIRAKARICHCLSKSKRPQEAIDVCTEAHQRDPRNIFILRDRAEAYILNEEFQRGGKVWLCTSASPRPPASSRRPKSAVPSLRQTPAASAPPGTAQPHGARPGRGRPPSLPGGTEPLPSKPVRRQRWAPAGFQAGGGNDQHAHPTPPPGNRSHVPEPSGCRSSSSKTPASPRFVSAWT